MTQMAQMILITEAEEGTEVNFSRGVGAGIGGGGCLSPTLAACVFFADAHGGAYAGRG